ncbi:MAG: transposase [Planctomycetota bacterium]
MCIPIDYAKGQHTALVCNGEGMQLRGTFNIHNTADGVAFLEDIIKGLCKKHSIRKAHVFFGGEDCTAFCYNFIHALLERKYLGIGINAYEGAEARQNQIASTDKLDLLGIASVLINKKHGRTLSTDYGQARLMRELTHQRDSLVKAHSASSYRIHHWVDQLMPGFLDAKQSGLQPFSEACLWLMSQHFSPRQILARKSDVLAEKLHLFMLRDTDAKVAKLKQMARTTLPPPAGLTETLQDNLAREVALYQHLNGTLHALNQQTARRLAATPGAMLTTAPGIGLILASGLYAEIGEPARQRNVASMAAYAGMVPRLKQTGGPDNPARSLGRSRRACVPLKRRVIDIALSIGQYGVDELKADYRRRDEAGQDVRFTVGRRMLRICMHLVRHEDFFLPPSLLSHDATEDRKSYYARVWDPLLIKWRNAGAIQQAFADGAPLERWRTMLNDLYKLNLSKLSPQYDRLRDR